MEVPVVKCKLISPTTCLLQVLIYSPDGRCLFKYLAYESGLGVKTVAWSPCGQFLAVGSYDQAVRTLNHLTWKTFAEFAHTASIRSPSNAAIFKVSLLKCIVNCHVNVHCFLLMVSDCNYKMPQEVDDPWQLDMSELCLSEGFSRNMQGNGAGEITSDTFISPFICPISLN